MTQERRAYSRVNTFTQAWARRLTSPEEPCRLSETAALSDTPPEEALRNSKLPDALIQFLIEMDSKLNAILSHLSRESLEDDFPYKLDVTEVSGAGVQVVTDLEFSQDEHLEVVLILSQLPLRLAGAVGRILRVEQNTSSVPGAYSIAVEFIRISSPDLDAVIRYVVQEERRQIRTEKWD